METNQKARELFTSVVKGKNFMTPDLIGYYLIKNGAAEITEGSGFGNNHIFGVTVVLNGAHDYELSKMCDTMTEAFEYVKELKKGINNINA